jgi:hypothetical protein
MVIPRYYLTRSNVAGSRAFIGGSDLADPDSFVAESSFAEVIIHPRFMNPGGMLWLDSP